VDADSSLDMSGQLESGLSPAHQRALVETVVDLDILTELVRRNLEDDDIRRVLQKLTSDDRDAFISKLSGLMRKTAALLLIHRRLSDSLFVDVLLPRLVELISEFLDAERCSVFLYDAETRELYTKAAVGLAGEIRFPATLGIAGAVLESHEPVLVHDAYADPRFNAEIDGETGFKTRDLLCAPLKHTREGEARTVGVIQALNKRRGSFTDDDLNLLEALSSPAAAALANALLHEQVRKAWAEESRLLEVSSEISKEISLRALLTKIVSTAVMVVGVERVTLWVQHPKTRELWALTGDGEGGPEGGPPSHPEIGAQVFRTGDVINIADPANDDRFDAELERLSGGRTRSLLCLPVRGRGGDVLAVAEALNKKGGSFSDDDEKRLEAFCGQAAIVMENSRLFDELKTNLAHLRSLLDASKALSTAVDLDSQLEIILLRAREVMEARQSRIFVFDETSQTLADRSTTGKGVDAIPLGVGLAGHAANVGKIVNTPDALHDPRFDPRVDQADGGITTSVLSAPMFTHRGRLIGVLQVLNKQVHEVFTPHDEALMEAFASHAGVALDRAQLIEASVEKQRIEDNLRVAHDIQMGMLRKDFPARPEFELMARLRPARAVGGDLYDFVTDGDHLWFSIGDVAGKGVGAALVMAVTQTLIHSRIGGSLSPGEVLERVNGELRREDDQALFVTAFIGRLDLRSGELAYSSAGHNPPFRVHPSGAVEPLDGGVGLPLALFEARGYETAQVQLEPGEALLLYTDGVSEAHDSEEEELTSEGLKKLLEKTAGATASDLVDRVFAGVEEFAGGAAQYDDITVVAVRYLAGSSQPMST